MIVFESGIDIRARSVSAPTVARFMVQPGEWRFIVIGTQYGYLHTSSGDIRTWRSYSGARRAVKRYVPL